MELSFIYLIIVVFGITAGTYNIDYGHPANPPHDLENVPTIDKYYNFLLDLGLVKLCTFLRSAKLDEFIHNLGLFTLFGPLDSAFDFIPGNLLQEIQINQSALQDFLLRHMTRDHVILRNLENDVTVSSVNGFPLRYNYYYNGEVQTISGAQIIRKAEKLDAMLVYTIDQVIYPIPNIEILNYIRHSHVKFYELLQKITQFNPGHSFTLFVPLDESFENIPKAVLDILHNNQTLLSDVLLNHFVKTRVFTPALLHGTVLKSEAGTNLTISVRRGIIHVNGVHIVQPDIQFPNGVVHLINRLLVPVEILKLCRCMPLSADSSISSAPSAIETSLTGRRYNGRPSFLVVSPGVSPRSQRPIIIVNPSYNRQLEFGARLRPTPSGFIYISPTLNQNSSLQTSKTILQFIHSPVLIAGQHPVKLTTVSGLLKKAGLLDIISHTNPLTAVLPSDEAFNSLPKDRFEELQKDVQLLKRMLLCHMIARNISPSVLENNIRLPTYGGVPLIANIIRKRKVILIGGAKVIATSQVTNGAVYVINRVIYPAPVQTTFLALKARPNVSQFLNLIQQAKLESLLTGSTLSTWFIPTNEAFKKIPESILDEIFKDPYSLQEFVLRHVVDGVHYSQVFVNDFVLKTHLGDDLNFVLTTDGIFVNGIRISVPDISTGNGVIHLTDSILPQADYTPPESVETVSPPMEEAPDKVTDTVITDEELEKLLTIVPIEETTYKDMKTTETTLTYEQTTETTPKDDKVTETTHKEETTSDVDTQTTTDGATTEQSSLLDEIKDQEVDTFIGWLNQSGLLDKIQDGEEYTIFVPTDDAINSLPPTLRSIYEKQPRKLKKALQHHIVPYLVDTDQMLDDETVSTLTPTKDVRINKYGNITTASGAIIKKQTKVGNVQILAVDKFLLPPPGDIHRTVSKSPLLKNFTKIIQLAGLEEELKNGGPYTLFAPSKKAFRKMSSEEYSRITSDPSAARDFVLRHLVRGTKYTSGIQNGASLASENGNNLTFMNHTDGISVNGKNFVFSDINSTNGVIHVIDDVL